VRYHTCHGSRPIAALYQTKLIVSKNCIEYLSRRKLRRPDLREYKEYFVRRLSSQIHGDSKKPRR